MSEIPHPLSEFRQTVHVETARNATIRVKMQGKTDTPAQADYFIIHHDSFNVDALVVARYLQ
ncbi:MAG: hypothetical protein ABFS56_13430 [Pseudomonadota bacterium]